VKIIYLFDFELVREEHFQVVWDGMLLEGPGDAFHGVNNDLASMFGGEPVVGEDSIWMLLYLDVTIIIFIKNDDIDADLTCCFHALVKFL